MTITPATRKRNDPQPVKRPLPGVEDISLHVSTLTAGNTAALLLGAGKDFVSTFDPSDKFQVTISIEKLPKEDRPNEIG
ncbi:hypothetical protein [Cohnella silvisoli]|uniref:Uncharacterized protein n=1 Tax=Cohnella silvisoli TaxID=2873699 RepID=A0ABV1L2D7_9BACL|nr:hypothetical protein [Cohnella silvisoli]MCD9025768.1 hypothetical protein [Cohnella silvisoli]